MPKDADLDRLIRLVARMCQAPVAVVTLIEEGRHRLLAWCGVSLPDPEILLAFAPATAAQGGPFAVGNALKDPNYERHPLVAREPRIRLYSGVPLFGPDGSVIGTLGVMDQAPGFLGDVLRDALEVLGQQVVAQLELRQYRRAAIGMGQERRRLNAMLVAHTRHLVEIAGRAGQVGAWVAELPSRRMLLSEQVAAIYERVAEPVVDLPEFLDYCVPEARARLEGLFEACIQAGTPFEEEVEAISGAGRRFWVRVIGHALRNSQGTPSSLYGAAQDVTERKLSQLSAQSVAARLASTLESIPDAFFTLNADWRFVYLNHQSERLLGRTRDQLLGRVAWKELRRTLQTAMEERAADAPGGTAPIEFERFYAPTKMWFELRAYPSEGGFAVYMRDVTERRDSHAQLRLLELSVSRLNDLVLITEASGDDPADQRLVFVNDAFERHTGHARGEVLGLSPKLLQGPKTQRAELDRIRAALRQHAPVRAELINYRKHGEEFWIELDIVPLTNERGRATHWVAVGRDITQRKAVVAEIQHLAFVDPLTRLPNRLLLMDRLAKALPASARGAEHGALMFIDLDNFKTLNDTLGHAMGDLLLQQVAQRLTSAVRGTDTVARLGGDEFVVMLVSLGQDLADATAGAMVAAEKILRALGAPYLLNGTEHFSTCSVGVTCFNGHEAGIGDLLKQADMAMYQAKSLGRNAVCLFDPDMEAAVTAHASLSSDLRQGLREQCFVVHYQPQVDGDGRMSGAEALVRWQHPQRGLLGPNDFIPVAEDSGLILPLGQWVLETACEQLAAWGRRPETSKLSIAVNVSVKQFRHPQFVELVVAAIERTGISPYRLKLELTETLLADGMEVTIAKMGILKDMGVTLSLDDFGMGYSALSSLKRIPLDQLKIDKTFVRDILRDPNDAAIARAIIAMAQSLGLGVVAEGVETKDQRDFLARQGCHCYQGYLFCKPLPIAELEAFMATLPGMSPAALTPA